MSLEIYVSLERYVSLGRCASLERNVRPERYRSLSQELPGRQRRLEYHVRRFVRS